MRSDTSRRFLIISVKILWISTLSFISLSVLVVLIFRWIPVPISAVVIEREIAAYFSDKPSHDRNMIWIARENIAPSASLAVIAAEDQRFFEHYGFDFKQLQKAVQESKQGKRLRGASTISQQTAKNLFLWGGRSYVRKVLEAWFTVLIEALWSKERVLEVYLNIIEFGPNIYGIEAASRNYFNKSAEQLSERESALLASVLPNPHRMHVRRPSSYVRERQYWIMEQMTQLKRLTELSNENRPK